MNERLREPLESCQSNQWKLRRHDKKPESSLNHFFFFLTDNLVALGCNCPLADAGERRRFSSLTEKGVHYEATAKV